MSYKNHQWTIMANDYNSPFIRNYIWAVCCTKYTQLFNIPNLVGGIFVDSQNMKYIFDEKRWGECHDSLRKKVLDDHKYFEHIIDWQMDFGKKFNNWTEKNIYQTDVKKLSAEKIVSLYKEFIDRQSTLYTLGVAIPILDFGNFSFVEGNLEKFLKSKLSSEEYNKAFRIFTEPTFNSFAKDQEIALLELINKFYNYKNWVNDIQNKSLTEIQNIYPKFFNLLNKHVEKFGWVYYVYAGPAYTTKDFIGFIQDYLKKNIDLYKKLKEIKNSQIQTEKSKKQWIKKLKPDSLNLMILNLAGKMVWAKPRRKDLQSLSYYHFEKLQREIGRRLQLSLAQVRSMPIEMIEVGLKGENIDLDKINQIQKYHICLPNDDLSVSILYGKDAKDFVDQNLEIVVEEVKDVSTIKGNCAFPGKVTGIVKVINLPQEMDKMEYGNILLSIGTSPSIVLAMKKAAAIITDEGGLTCHAAIVSRELEIPCVVGLKIATKILKDGDVVEVDANNGIIKKL